VALLAVCALGACAEDTPPLPPPEPPVGMGLVSVSGKRSVEQTLDRVEAKLKEDDGQSIVVRPTTLLLISDPRSEEELTSSKRTFAVDLPLRVLVYDDARGETRVAYNDAAYLARRHLVTGEERAVRRLGEQLEKVVREAG